MASFRVHQIARYVIEGVGEFADVAAAYAALTASVIGSPQPMPVGERLPTPSTINPVVWQLRKEGKAAPYRVTMTNEITLEEVFPT